MKKHSRKWSKKDEGLFVKIYIDHIGLIFNLSPSEQKVLVYILKNMGQNTNIFSMNTHHRKKMTSAHKNLGDVTIYHALSSLVRKKILFRVEKGVYRVNPKYFAKASWDKVLAMRYTIIRQYDKTDYRVTLYESTDTSKMTDAEIGEILVGEEE